MYIDAGFPFSNVLTLFSASQIELPDVDIFWQPEYSTKIPVSFKPFTVDDELVDWLGFQTKDREIKFEILRRSLHKVFMSHEEEEAWSKLSAKSLDGYRRYAHSGI